MKKKKEEVVDLKKEKKIAQKGMKKKFGKEIKSKRHSAFCFYFPLFLW